MRWSLRARCTIASLVLLAVACGVPPKIERPSPDILLVVVDCLRGDTLGAMGYPRPVSPSIDALAAEGTLFERAFSVSSWTRPVLPTLLTGLHPSEHGLLAPPRKGKGRWKTPRLPAEVRTLPERLAERGYATALIGEQHLLSPRFGLAQGFETYEYRADVAERIGRWALDWLDAETERPTFLMLHYLDIHWPYCPPESTRGRFDRGWSEIDFCGDWRALRDAIYSGAVVLDDGDRMAMRARYDEELLALDAEIGRLIEALRQRGRWDEALVVLTSDHGEEFFEHGSFGHGQSLFDELVHVPLVVKPPASWQAPAGRRVGTLVGLDDLVPTLLAAAGDPAPGGNSLLSWALGESGGAREFVVAQTDLELAVRTSTSKLIVDLAEGEHALYDLVADPGETRDVAAERPEELERLKTLLRRWRRGLEPISAESAEVDEETMRGLEALGYLD